MRDTDDHSRKKIVDQLLGSLMLLSFGCLMLAYLVAIDARSGSICAPPRARPPPCPRLRAM
jgi:hypothetical protein